MYQLTCNSCDQQYIHSTTQTKEGDGRYNYGSTRPHDRVKEHLKYDSSSVEKHIYSCQNKDYKGIEVKIITSENDPPNLRIMKHFTLESASLHSIPGWNVVNSKTFYFSILETILTRFQRSFF